VLDRHQQNWHLVFRRYSNNRGQHHRVLPKQLSGTIQPQMKLSKKFPEALIYATRAHGDQMRKKTGIPHIAHFLGVIAIALVSL